MGIGHCLISNTNVYNAGALIVSPRSSVHDHSKAHYKCTKDMKMVSPV